MSELGTRAVSRLVEAGSDARCAACDHVIKWQARTKPRYVIANVYENGRWDRVESFHQACYLEAGQPYGEPA